MRKWLRRIRGVVGTALTWAVGWSVVGALFGLVTVALGFDPVSALLWIPGSWAILGLIGGTIFSTVLGIVEGRRRFDQLSVARFAVWGTVGSLGVSLLVVANGVVMGPVQLVGLGIVTLLGGGSAAGSLALARRADDRELLEDGAGVADIGLTEQEERELLGT